jgi:hypothetical protein
MLMKNKPQDVPQIYIVEPYLPRFDSNPFLIITSICSEQIFFDVPSAEQTIRDIFREGEIEIPFYGIYELDRTANLCQDPSRQYSRLAFILRNPPIKVVRMRSFH